MARRLLVAFALLGCDAGAKPRDVVDPWSGSGSEARDESPRGRQIASGVAYSDAAPYLDGENVYARFDDENFFGLGAVAREGGPVHRIAGDFVHHGVVYRVDWPAHERAEVIVSQEIDGKRRVTARVPHAIGGKDFTVVAEYMYWTAALPSGVGRLMATDVRTGATRTALECSAFEVCPRIVPGTPALAYLDDGSVYRLERGGAVWIKARCPRDPQTGLSQEPVRAMGAYMLCEMRAIGAYDRDPGVIFPRPLLVSLEDGSSHAPHGLGVDTTFARGHWYHPVPGGIARRRSIDGPDEVVMQIDHGFDTMVVDDETLLWINGSAMWSAPLSP